MHIKEKAERLIMNTYNWQQESTLLIRRGQGVYVWDEKGNRYLDFVSGLAVNNLGHCHPAVVEAIRTQAEKLLHVSNLYYSSPQVELAEIIVENTAADKVFFCNSGAEANEAAIKLARKYGKTRHGEQSYEIITAKRSFHGRTLAAVTATGQPKYHQSFQPMVSGFRYADFNDASSFAELINSNTCAIMVEPIQGEGGVYTAESAFLSELRRLCDEHGLLMIFDEVQTGIGRTGKLMAYEHYGVEPDLFTMAKALGGGLPIGALGAKGEAAETFAPGDHASTFGGNPTACAAAAAVLRVLLDEEMMTHVETAGSYFKEGLSGLQASCTAVTDVRGKGLLLAVEVQDAVRVANSCRQKGLLINSIGDSVLRFLPPLIVEKEHIDIALNTLDSAL